MSKPIDVYDGVLTISQSEMRMWQRYDFRYLDVDMVAIRTSNGVDVYQSVDYLNEQDELERGKGYFNG